MKRARWIAPALVLVLPDGSEYLLTQEWNGWTEPYTVSFWFRDRDGEWGWCHVDHESFRWRDVSLRHELERDSVQVLRAGSLEAELFLGRRTFALVGATRELEAPQEIRRPPFPVAAAG